MVLAARDLAYDHVIKNTLKLGRFDYSVSVVVSEAKLTLVGVAAAENFILIRHEDRMATSSLQILDLFSAEGFLGDQFGLPDVFHCSVVA